MDGDGIADTMFVGGLGEAIGAEDWTRSSTVSAFRSVCCWDWTLWSRARLAR